MKKIKILLLLSISSLILFSCNSINSAGKDKFSVDLRNSSNITISEVEIQFNRAFPIPGLRLDNVTVSYFPDEDTVCFHYKADFISYYQFWNRNGRDSYIRSLEKYNDDYDKRNLERSGRRTKQKYEHSIGYLIWQSSALSDFSSVYNANFNLHFGYFFVDRAPYFTATQRETIFIDPNFKNDRKTTQERTLYFTRAQAAELAAIFDQEFLEGLAANRVRSGGVNFDVY